MPNERIPRRQYQVQVGKTLWKGLICKLLHILARNMPFPHLRLTLYRWMGIKIGQRVFIGLDSYLDDQFSMAMDFADGVFLGPRVTAVVHDDEGFSPAGPGSIYRKGLLVLGHVGPISLREGAIVGTHATLLPGVIVGERAIAQPGAVVTKDVPAHTVVAGAPARVVWSREENDRTAEIPMLPSNHVLREEYDARMPKSPLRLAYQYFTLCLARFTLPTRLRVTLYRAMGAHIGKDVYIGLDTYLDERYPELITFEDDSGPSFRSTYVTQGETYDPEGNRIRYVAPIVVKRAAWSGSNTVVCPGVTIGEGAVVGTGSVITEDIPDFAVVVGNPAHVIKFRTLRGKNAVEDTRDDELA